ncbi:hypothetical protein K492DRAFT_209450 [Lichtheimia hyalospora FSU 10163]|nr:hypothetical protein K492DRAFT_209450 [Lichtheimia hyalospora FSU 10163]
MKKNDDMQEQDVSSSVAPRDDDDTWIVRKLAKALYHGTSKSTLVNDKSVSVATDSPPSPALTAVDHNDDLYSRHQPPTTKSRRTIRSCLSALLMVVIGTLVALAFILIGVGSALTGNEDQNDHSATFAMPSAADADNDVSNPSSISTIYTTSSSTTTTTFIQPAPSL